MGATQGKRPPDAGARVLRVAGPRWKFALEEHAGEQMSIDPDARHQLVKQLFGKAMEGDAMSAIAFALLDLSGSVDGINDALRSHADSLWQAIGELANKE